MEIQCSIFCLALKHLFIYVFSLPFFITGRIIHCDSSLCSGKNTLALAYNSLILLKEVLCCTIPGGLVAVYALHTSILTVLPRPANLLFCFAPTGWFPYCAWAQIPWSWPCRALLARPRARKWAFLLSQLTPCTTPFFIYMLTLHLLAGYFA